MPVITTLNPGDFVRPTTTVNLRRSPGYVGKSAADVVAQVASDDLLRVLDGTPRQVDGLIWWNVAVAAAGTQGWIAQTAPGSGAPLVEQAPSPVPSELAVGAAARALAAVNLRQSPGYRNKPATDVIATIPPNITVQVTDGPRLADALVWWLVRAPVEGHTASGWMAESTPAGARLLERATIEEPPGEPPTTLSPGGEAITQTTVRLRRTPGHANQPSGDVIGDVPPHARVQLVDGPRQADGLTWWQVDAPLSGQTQRGWMAETAPNGTLLLAPASSSGDPALPAVEFGVGDLVRTATSLRARRAPGHLDEQPGDVLGTFWPGIALFVRGGPQQADGLSWWLVNGIAANGNAITGWSAQRLADGTALIIHPPKLPGTDVPTPDRNRYLGAPFHGRQFISQLFGENPNFYGQFIYDGVRLRGHNALDFPMPVGTDLWATDNGQVIQVANDANGYGNYVLIRHLWGESLYAHMSQVAVNIGQQVSRGQFIGDSGNTGASTGPHLHFGIRINPYQRGDGWGGFSDPLPYLGPGSYTLPAYIQKAAARSVDLQTADTMRANMLPPTPLSPEITEITRP